MNQTDAHILAHTLMEQYGLLDEGWTLAFDKRSSRAGACTYSKKVITLSKTYLAVHDEVEVRDTVTHEIAHALVGPSVQAHGNTWRAQHRSMGGSGLTRVRVPERGYIPTKGMKVIVNYPMNNKWHGRTGVVEKVNRVRMDVRIDDIGSVITANINLFEPLTVA